jgi:hypothetical protein
MTITKLHEIWDVLNGSFPRDEWIHLQSIYEMIQTNIQLRPDDFLPSAPNSSEPKWMRNVRNVLQQRKNTGYIGWDKNGKYMIPTMEINISDDSITAKSNIQYKISEERFKKIKESREAIGQAGEKWVMDYERSYLTTIGKFDLAKRITRISETNIAAGYDVLSFELDNSEKFIEVKTTALSKAEFFISANELGIAKQLNGNYWIYLVSEIYGEPKLITIQDPTKEIGKKLILTPINYQVQMRA